MGNDEHSQNVFKKAAEEGLDPLAYCDRMEQRVPPTPGSGSTSRSTTSSARPSRATKPASPSSSSASTTPATSTRASTRAGTASAARRSSRKRISSTASVPLHLTHSRSGSARRTTSSGCRSTSSRSSITSPPPRVPAARGAAQRDPAAARGRSRRHLGQPRRAVVGHSAAVRSLERRLRLVRRADQLRVGRRPGQRSRAVREVVAGRSARHRQGHHPVSYGDLAGDADEREAARCRGRSSATGS